MSKVSKIVLSLVLLVLGIGGVSYFAIAQEQNNTPENAITAFYDNAKQGHQEEAKKYVASEVIQYYKNPSWFNGTISAAIKREANEYISVKPQEGKAKIQGETATVPVNVTNKDGSKEVKTYSLVKENGEWKLTFQ